MTKLMNTSENKNERVFGMVAGPPGVGKTTQMTTFPVKETLGVSIEKGFLSIQGSGHAYVELETYSELIDFLNNFKKTYPWCKYLFIDSLTELFDRIKHTERDNFEAKQNFAKFDEIQDQMLHAVRVAAELGITVFFVCHTKDVKDGILTVQDLCFDGKLPALVKKAFDLIVHMDFMEIDGKKTRVFKTSPEISNVAKRRVSPWLNIEVADYEEPNLYKLTQKLLGK